MRSRTPHSEKFLKYIGSNWADRANNLPEVSAVAPFASSRRQAVAKQFAGELILIEAGATKVRSNDTDYMYRAHSAFAHLTGWGSQTVADSVLVIDARTTATNSILFFSPTAGRDSEEFFANAAIGEFWVGARPTLSQVAALLDIETKPLSELEAFIGDAKAKSLEDEQVAQFVSELRLVKDEYEISEMRSAVAASIKGFEAVARNLVDATLHERGERVVETAFYSQARIHGNNLGYDTIAASGAHACILHWTNNDGAVHEGDLILVDAGVELDSLYTADITHTLPINGKFSPIQKKIYEAVLEAADAAFAVAKSGVKFKDVHAAAMAVIARKVSEWGLIDMSAEESLQEENQLHRRWMVHGTSHHLGLDVHDCQQARKEMYLEAELQPGMVFTIEPGLYFHADDLMVPEEYRGIGVRIEDDVLVTADGVENLSAALPRKVEELEAWVISHQN